MLGPQPPAPATDFEGGFGPPPRQCATCRYHGIQWSADEVLCNLAARQQVGRGLSDRRDNWIAPVPMAHECGSYREAREC